MRKFKFERLPGKDGDWFAVFDLRRSTIPGDHIAEIHQSYVPYFEAAMESLELNRAVEL